MLEADAVPIGIDGAVPQATNVLAARAKARGRNREGFIEKISGNVGGFRGHLVANRQVASSIILMVASSTSVQDAEAVTNHGCVQICRSLRK